MLGEGEQIVGMTAEKGYIISMELAVRLEVVGNQPQFLLCT